MHTRGFHGWIQLLLLINNNNNSRLHVSIYRIKNRCHIMYILILYKKKILEINIRFVMVQKEDHSKVRKGSPYNHDIHYLKDLI
jgi:hypothetical protein